MPESMMGEQKRQKIAAEVIGSLSALESFRDEWTALHRQCDTATPFQSPEWLLPWIKHLFGGGDIWALAFRSSGQLIGFAPLFCWGTERRTISFLGAGVSDYGDLIYFPERGNECACALWRFLEENRSAWDALDLQEIRAGSVLLEGAGAPEELSICPVLDLSTYPGSMDHKHRTDVRRAQNKLKRNFETDFAFAGATDIERNLHAFFELHGMRWGVLDPALIRFHEDAAAALLNRGMLRLAMLRIDGKPAAAIYAFLTGRTLYCYLSGYDPSLAKLSPGAVLLGWLIDRAIEEGLKEVDFLRQTEAYKYLWGACDRINYRLSRSTGC